MPQKNAMLEVAKLGNEILQHVVEAYTTKAGVHGETVIGALSALSGEYALKASTNILQKADGFVDGSVADGLLFAGEQAGRYSIWTIVYGYALSAGAPQTDVPNILEIVDRVEKSKGGENFPPLSVPMEHFPQEWSPDACLRFRSYIQSIAARDALTPDQTCLALAFALGFLIAKVVRDGLNAKIALTLAGEIMIGVSRIAPLTRPMT